MASALVTRALASWLQLGVVILLCEGMEGPCIWALGAQLQPSPDQFTRACLPAVCQRGATPPCGANLQTNLPLPSQASDDVSFTVLKDAGHRLHTHSHLNALAATVLALWEHLQPGPHRPR